MNIIRLGHVELRVAQRPRAVSRADRRENVILVHGLASNIGLWYFRIAPSLAKRYRVTMFDLPGHGRSSLSTNGYRPADIASDMQAMMDRLGIEEAHVVGHSFGGAVVMNYAHLFPERVRTITLIDSRLRALQQDMPIKDWPMWPRYQALLARHGIEMDEKTSEFGFELLVKMARLRIDSPRDSLRLSRILPISLLGSSGQSSAQRWLDLASRPEVRDDLINGETLTEAQIRGIDKPVLGVYGEVSPNMRTAHRLQELWPEARVEVVPKVGHYFTDSHPDNIVHGVCGLIEHRSVESGLSVA